MTQMNSVTGIHPKPGHHSSELLLGMVMSDDIHDGRDGALLETRVLPQIKENPPTKFGKLRVMLHEWSHGNMLKPAGGPELAVVDGSDVDT